MSQETTKAFLRRRWRDPAFVAGLGIPLDSEPSAESLCGLDLRGVPKLDNGEPLWHFAIRNGTCEGIDFTFGDGCLIIVNSSVARIICEQFRFDRASYLMKSVLSESSFARAQLKWSAQDVSFLGCSFDRSTFAGGFNEYGFRRCTFQECTFRDAKWRNIYLRACRFTDCDMSGWQVRTSIVAGIKHRGSSGFSLATFADSETQGVEEIS